MATGQRLAVTPPVWNRNVSPDTVVLAVVSAPPPLNVPPVEADHNPTCVIVVAPIDAKSICAVLDADADAAAPKLMEGRLPV
jgi:hypothetical protein